ncbi:Dihydroneopterin aldolase-domain-containing protein [Collybia nuda]|uniref:dihydroneopterin aldolase n=1 Tax=Collybia nuda TaxID=64659 RepID=A0A9P6CPU4_9AGAR|nr:Dihydroneopterin aldolase-domain-containing protein [Collybia nuda]
MSNSRTDSSKTDVVFIDTLALTANVGPDCWGRERVQPVNISVYLHLETSYLTAAGRSDDVLDSVHYGHLSKAITGLVRDKADAPFGNVDALVKDVSEQAFLLAGLVASEVRVVIDLPKQILLAANFSIDVLTPRDLASTFCARKITITDLIIPVVIGVNPPEREAKQRVITNIIIVEKEGHHPTPKYPEIVSRISKDIESSSYLTLEKFVLEIVQTACLSSEVIEEVTVRAQKPSALSFAHSSGVQITRQRTAFV